MKNYILIIALALITVFFAGIYVSKEYLYCKNNMETSFFFDTVYKEIPVQPLIIEKVRTKIRYKTDTLLLTAPFEARIDTVIKYDTIATTFDWPENIFSLSVRRRPDTLLFTKEIEIRTVENPRPWWELPAGIAGGFLTGYFVSSIKNGK